MPLLIHPGFHKTGTTWLQQQLFSDTKYFNMLFSHEDIDRLFIRPHTLTFSTENTTREVKAACSPEGSPLIDVISSETLSGEMFTGSRLSALVAERLADTCKPAKILLTVRSQLAVTRSIYIQYLKRGGRLSIEAFLGYQPEPNYGWFNADVIHYGRLAQHYGTQFGDENVLVLPQELMAKDRQAWLGHLFRFATGEDFSGDLSVDARPREGVSPPASGMALLRTANLFRKGPLSPNAATSLGWLGTLLHRAAYKWKLGDKAAQKHLKDVIAAHFAGQFGETNRLLQGYCPVDLATLGYEMT